MIPSLMKVTLVSDMPPKRASAARRGRTAAVGGARQGRGATRAREQMEPEILLLTVGSEIGELREAVQLLTQIVARQAHRQEAVSSQAIRRDSSRARDFLACGPP